MHKITLINIECKNRLTFKFMQHFVYKDELREFANCKLHKIILMICIILQTNRNT